MKAYKIIAAGLLAVTFSSCELDEKYYSQVTPDTFLTNKTSVKALASNPYGFFHDYFTRYVMQAQEMTTDEFTCPTKDTGDWYNGGEYWRLHYHEWLPTDDMCETVWPDVCKGFSRCMTVLETLEGLDLKGMGFTDEEVEELVYQTLAMKYMFYEQGLDFYGGMPIYNSTYEGNKPRSTARQTFDYIEAGLKDCIEHLKPRPSANAETTHFLDKGGCAALLARLYFNAEVYIGESRWQECAALCQDIIDGKYGPYALGSTWNEVFGFDNASSSEMIFSIPSDQNMMRVDWYARALYPRNVYKYFDLDPWYYGQTGWCLTPSRNPAGEKYLDVNPEIKLGSPYESYDDTDLRKQPYKYRGNKNYTGMFLIGELPGVKAYDGKRTVVLVDQIYELDAVDDEHPAASFPSTIKMSSEFCGVRPVKMPVPNDADRDYWFKSSWPTIRLAEIYYTLAECKLRMGDKNGACKLINTVRKRNFKRGEDPNPCTSSNLDMYRMAKEWMIEFLFELRRRTDLIRMDFYETEKWWDYTPKGNKNLQRLPLPLSAFATNPLLKQNPGYDGADQLTPEEM
jgi:hypothetical protein